MIVKYIYWVVRWVDGNTTYFFDGKEEFVTDIKQALLYRTKDRAETVAQQYVFTDIVQVDIAVEEPDIS